MTLQGLKPLVANGESETVEFKETTGQRGKPVGRFVHF
jgi:hypothetical protein